MIIRALQFERGASPQWRFAAVRDRRKIGANKPIRVFGDSRSASLFQFHLKTLLEKKGKLKTAAPFDLEPLDALCEFLRFPESALRLESPYRLPSVGGPPQVIRLRAGATATPIAVRWRDGQHESEFLLGRRCLGYERLDVPLLETDGGMSFHPPGAWTPRAA
jgi:hypothetical protein